MLRKDLVTHTSIIIISIISVIGVMTVILYNQWGWLISVLGSSAPLQESMGSQQAQGLEWMSGSQGKRPGYRRSISNSRSRRDRSGAV